MEVKLCKQQKVTVNSTEDIYPIMRQILRRENKISQGQEDRRAGKHSAVGWVEAHQ